MKKCNYDLVFKKLEKLMNKSMSQVIPIDMLYKAFDAKSDDDKRKIKDVILDLKSHGLVDYDYHKESIHVSGYTFLEQKRTVNSLMFSRIANFIAFISLVISIVALILK